MSVTFVCSRLALGPHRPFITISIVVNSDWSGIAKVQIRTVNGDLVFDAEGPAAGLLRGSIHDWYGQAPMDLWGFAVSAAVERYVHGKIGSMIEDLDLHLNSEKT